MRINSILYFKLLVFFFTLPFLGPIVGLGLLKIALVSKYIISILILFFGKKIVIYSLEKWYIYLFILVLGLLVYNYSFKVDDIKSFAYFFLICLEFYIIFKLSSFFDNNFNDNIYNISKFIVLFITFLNIIGIFLIIIGYSGSMDIRHNPFGPTTMEYSGVFLTTNYATLFSAIGILFSFYILTVFKKNNVFYFAFLFNFTSLLLYHSRTQTLFVVGILLLYMMLKNKKYFIYLLVLILLFITVNYESVLEILDKFLRIQNLIERGILGNRGVLMGYVLDNIQMVGFSGLGLGNARYIWTIDGVTTSNLSTIDIGNMTGLNMHSAIFNYLVELSILGVFIFYFIR